ncbi:MAG TPA: ABC transporter permease [Gemmatimonadales bacterium]|nr:ABC transporter permease [Gemmatimonadales bacterium]
MDALLQDIRYAARTLLKSPGFTIVAVITLAIGIGANSAVFSVVHSLLFDPLPWARGDRLVAVWEVGPQGNDHNEFSAADFRDFRAAARSFDRLVAHAWWPATLTGGTEPERVQGFVVSPDYFEALGVRPLQGRTFAPDEDLPGKDRVVVLSYGLWQRRFGADSGIVGRSIAVNGIQRTVIGVLPPRVAYPAPGDIWAPLALDSAVWQSRRSHWLLVTGRLAPGVSVARAQAELATIAGRLRVDYPATNTGWGVNVRPLERDVARQVEPVLLTLLAGVAFVLLIACVNVANLVLARGTGRRRELAMRATLGAGRPRLVRQLLTESTVLALSGGAAGVLLATWGVGLLRGLVPAEQQRFLAGFDRIGINGPVLLFTAAASLLTALLFGLAPALRSAAADLHVTLQEGERSGGAPTRHRLRRALVAVEVALALVLLVGARLMFRSVHHLLDTPPGFDTDSVALTGIVLPNARYETPERAVAFFHELVERVATLPGVSPGAVGAANVVPLCQCNQTTSFGIVGAPPFPPGERPDVGWRVVTPGYFAALGVPLVAGRGLADRDDARAPRVVVVNQTLARRYFPDGAVGRRLAMGPDTATIEIVGVAADVRHDGPARLPAPELYLPLAQAPVWEMTLAVRAQHPATILPALRTAVQAIDHDLPVAEQRTMRDAFSAVLGPHRLTQRLLGWLGAIALLLAAVGIYAVVAQLVVERTREIGIRIALGGRRAAVLGVVLQQGITPAAWGLVVGAAGAVALTQALRSQLFGVRPGDPATIVLVAGLLFGVAALATYAPARRATRIEPMEALRYE